MIYTVNSSLKDQERLARQKMDENSLYKTKREQASEAAKKAVKQALDDAELSFESFDGDEDLRFLLAVDEETGNGFRKIWFDKIAKGDDWMSQTHKTIGANFSTILYDEIKELPNHTDIQILVDLVEKRTVPLLNQLQKKYGRLKQLEAG